jgi:glycosyltransferase involved in cell wall biosynthesis
MVIADAGSMTDPREVLPLRSVPAADLHAERHSSPRRVALLFGSFRTGGVGRVSLHAAREFLARGFAVDLVVTRKRGDLLGAIPEGARVIELERCSLWRARAAILRADPGNLAPLLRAVLLREKPSGKLRHLPSLVGYLRATRPHAVLAATAPLNLIAIWARRLARLDHPVVVGEHTMMSGETLGGRRWFYDCPPALLHRAYLQADALIAVSDGVAAEMAAYADIPRHRITTVYNPAVGSHVATMARSPPDHDWFTPDGPPIVLGVGNLKPQKDFVTLIRAFARVRAERPARLVILGDARGPDKDASYVAALKRLPTELGIDKDVSFAGFAENPFAYMSRAAVFVLSSAWEGLPTVLAEALACGCPVVSTDCPSGPAEILEQGRYGPLVPVGDDAALAAAIRRVLDAPPPRDERIGRAALFSVERAVDRYLELMFGSARPTQTLIAKPSLLPWRSDSPSTGKSICSGAGKGALSRSDAARAPLQIDFPSTVRLCE